jgi:transcriptional regulator with XRE-family HTH domain
MASLPNYLRTHRKRHTLSQEEVAYLLGCTGAGRSSKVSLDENLGREMRLRTALAYEALYGISIRELFAGTFEEVQQEILERAKVMRHKVSVQSNGKKLAFITNFINRILA